MSFSSLSLRFPYYLVESRRYPWSIVKLYKNQCVHENNTKNKNLGQDAGLSTDSFETNIEKILAEPSHFHFVNCKYHYFTVRTMMQDLMAYGKESSTCIPFFRIKAFTPPASVLLLKVAGTAAITGINVDLHVLGPI